MLSRAKQQGGYDELLDPLQGYVIWGSFFLTSTATRNIRIGNKNKNKSNKNQSHNQVHILQMPEHWVLKQTWLVDKCTGDHTNISCLVEFVKATHHGSPKQVTMLDKTFLWLGSWKGFFLLFQGFGRMLLERHPGKKVAAKPTLQKGHYLPCIWSVSLQKSKMSMDTLTI